MPDGAPHLGEQVFANGWRQGSLFAAEKAPFSWLQRVGAPPAWRATSKPLKQDDFLVVASQNCDIKKKDDEEPRVEVVRAFWTENPRIIGFGANTVRYFVFQVRDLDGRREALAAEARTRIHIEKKYLIDIVPQSAFQPGDLERPLRFSKWLALRYDRPAVPAALERGVQQPLRDAYEKLPESDEVRTALARVDHILFQKVRPGSAARIQVHVYIMGDGGRATAGPLTPEDAAVVGDWIARTLADAGQAELESWEMAGTDTISYLAYVSHHALYLDE